MTPIIPAYFFEVFPGRNGRWRVRRSDGLVDGLFVDQLSAIRFARRECPNVQVLLRQ